jgi:glycerol kinase
MLLNIHTGQWDDEILEMLDIPKRILPEIRESAEIYGYTDPSTFLGAEIPISGSAVDQQAALFGQACFKPGMVKTTYGTGCFMLMNTGDKPVYSQNGLLTTVGWRLNHKTTFALDGGVYIAGAAVQWLRDGLKIIESAGQIEQLARSAEDTGGVYFVPAFAGLAAPYWDQYARGTMIGITRGTTREHIARATEESIAYQVKDNLDVMVKDSVIPIEVMRADGGAVRDEFLMQFQADILGIPVDVPVITETTALGAAYLAAYGIGEFRDLREIESKWKLYKRYEPKMSSETREKLLRNWHRAVERSRRWIEE